MDSEIERFAKNWKLVQENEAIRSFLDQSSIKAYELSLSEASYDVISKETGIPKGILRGQLKAFRRNLIFVDRWYFGLSKATLKALRHSVALNYETKDEVRLGIENGVIHPKRYPTAVKGVNVDAFRELCRFLDIKPHVYIGAIEKQREEHKVRAPLRKIELAIQLLRRQGFRIFDANGKELGA